MLVVTTMVLAQMLLRSVWRKSPGDCGSRTSLSGEERAAHICSRHLSTRIDRSFLAGRLHHQGGIIYFLIALAAISFLIWIARYGDGRCRVWAKQIIDVRDQ